MGYDTIAVLFFYEVYLYYVSVRGMGIEKGSIQLLFFISSILNLSEYVLIFITNSQLEHLNIDLIIFNSQHFFSELWDAVAHHLDLHYHSPWKLNE